MRFMRPTLLCASSLLMSSFAMAQDAANAVQYKSWQHSGSLMLLTTLEGANLRASAVVETFPVLVRLHKDWFDFPQAKPMGDDIRLSSAVRLKDLGTTAAVGMIGECRH